MRDNRVPNERLRDHRKLRGWSQQDLVDEVLAMGHQIGENNLGLTFKQVSRWEQGWAKPRPPYTKLLVLVFGVSAQELGLYDLASLPGSSRRESELRRDPSAVATQLVHVRHAISDPAAHLAQVVHADLGHPERDQLRDGFIAPCDPAGPLSA